MEQFYPSIVEVAQSTSKTAVVIGPQLRLEHLNTDTSGGDDGSSAGGIAGLTVEQLNAYLYAHVIQLLRDGERQFASVPISDDPNSLIGQKADKKLTADDSVEEFLPHPLLKDTQQFSGVDQYLTPIPSDNTEVVEHYPQLRLQMSLRKRHSQLHTPTLSL